MNMTIAELLAFDVAPADASLHIELSKDEHTQYSTLSSTRCLVDARDTNFSLNWLTWWPIKLLISVATSSCSTQGRPMESSDPTRGEAGVGVRTQYSTFMRLERKNAYTEDGRIQEKLPERDKQYGALAQRYPHFGSLDGAVTAATPLEIGSLICFVPKRGMHSLSCDQTVYGEEALSIGIVTTNHCNQDTLASLVLLSNVVVQELRLIKKTCYSTHLIDGTMPFRMIDGRQVIESTSAHAEQRFAAFGACPACEMPPAEPLQAAQMPPRKQGAQLQQKGSLTTKQRASQQSKEGLFEAWSHAQHQPKRRAPQATFDRPPRARKRSERIFEDF
ncbi:BQ5605_C007g04789 [Microbotryum silenes-dioicae]|uniref:BQ5605_C007g04789 protein n=1 Tax=Microbotryum silenes-dioicae TaxID=796604 RepID=A0A2X0MV44_9BASI|nr:BQ5605_C007g04789 [Microbotryum silenes-dioicae]